MDSTAPYIHYSQLWDAPEGSSLATEWETYKREVARLLAEGQEGRFALVKGDKVVSVWDTMRDAMQIGYEKFGRGEFMVHQVQTWEKVVHVGRWY